MDPTHRFRVLRLGETTSTNAVALEAAAAGEPEGLVVVADHQTAGRGRLGRTWSAPPGTALLMSVLLRPPPAMFPAAVSALGCAAAAACGRFGFEPGLKWPNDLVGGGAKLGGILAEATTGGNVTALVVGLGLNLTPPPGRPPEVVAVAADLEVLARRPVGGDEILASILAELEPRYAGLLAWGPAGVLDEYRRRCVTVGRPVRVEQATGHIQGMAVGIDGHGRLVVERGPGDRVTVEVGDVVHLRTG